MAQPGITALRVINVGKEITPGTAVAATALLGFSGMIQDDREVIWPDEHVGYLSGRDRAYVSKLGATLELEGQATFEQLPYILDASVAKATPTTDTGSGYIYTYTFGTNSAIETTDLQTFTIETGDNVEAEEMEYSYCSEFTLSGSFGEVWQLSATFHGRQASTCTVTPSTDITVSTVEEIHFTRTKLYIDAVGASSDFGTTEITGSLVEASLNVNTGWVEKPVASGFLYFSGIKNVGSEITLDITLEHDANAIAQKTLWRAGTARLLRLSLIGASLSSSGAYSTKTVNIDLAGKWEKFEKIGERDGNDILQGTFRARYNTTAAFYARAVVVNEVSALP